MIITIEEKDKLAAKRLLATDDVFYLLSEIDSFIRSKMKYTPSFKDDKEEMIYYEEVLSEVRDMIHAENLLDLYN